jgi:uncharacterized oxidoreductase
MNHGSRAAIVTGGSTGLGLELARYLFKTGRPVIACARTASALDRAAAEVPGLSTVVADIGTEAGRAALWAHVARSGAVVDTLVNNAAITRAHDYTNAFTLESDRARAEIEVNLAAPIELTRLFLRYRRDTGLDGEPGAVVMIGTPGGLIPLAAQPLYSATKAGLHMFTQTLRRQLSATPVHVVEVFPPALPTALTEQIETDSDNGGPEMVAEVARRIVDDLARGVEVVLPHPQSERLYHALPELDAAFVDRVNAGVRRRPGWDQPH